MAHAPSPSQFDPMQAAYSAGQELYKAGLLATINARRAARGRGAVAWPVVGSSTRLEVHSDGAARLFRYLSPIVPQPGAAPLPALLLVCSLINRPYVLDLIEERSVIRRLLAGGIDVWLLDWGTPLPSDAKHGIGHYALEVLPRAVEVVRRGAGVAGVHLLGYCMGGTFALASAAAGAIEPASLVAMATPVDLHDSGLLSTWCRAPGLDAEELARTHGNIPPYLLQPAFKMLDPVAMATKLAHLEPKMEDDAFVRFFLAMETWLEDSVAFPGRAFAEWVAAYQANSFVRGKLVLDGHPVDLGRVRCPLLSIVAENDYICPPTSSLALRAVAGSRDQELIVQPGGHIGLSTGKGAHQALWPRVAAWITARDAAPAAAQPPAPATPPDAPAPRRKKRVARAHKNTGARR